MLSVSSISACAQMFGLTIDQGAHRYIKWGGREVLLLLVDMKALNRNFNNIYYILSNMDELISWIYQSINSMTKK